MTRDFKELIPSLCGLMSVSGWEVYSRDKLLELIGDEFDESYVDNVGNQIFVKKCGRENAPRILIDTHMDEIGMYVTEILEGGFDSAPAAPAEPEKKYGCVAVCAGKGMEEVFREIGVDNIVTGGQTMNPSTETILACVEKTPAEVVIILPNNKNIIMAAEQCIPLSTKKVIVLPTKTVPQGVAAMVAFDPDAEEDELEAMMRESADNVRTAQITYAARTSDFDGQEIHEGDFLTFYEGRLLSTCRSFDGAYAGLCEAAKEREPEMITVFYGQDVSEDEAGKLSAALEAAFPDAEVAVVSGGQPVYYYMVSFE